MDSSATYPISPAWLLLMRDLALSAEAIFRRAGVAPDLLTRSGATPSADEYCRLS